MDREFASSSLYKMHIKAYLWHEISRVSLSLLQIGTLDPPVPFSVD